VVSEWKWMRRDLPDKQKTPNAIDFRNRTFNIAFNERFTDTEIEDIIKAILKVESHYAR